MVIGLVIGFAFIVYTLGHATRVWMRTYKDTRDIDASEAILKSGLLTDEEQQKMQARLNEKLRK